MSTPRGAGVVSATTGARVVPLPPPDPAARTVFYLCQTAQAAYHESPYQVLGEGVLAVAWWPRVLTLEERAGIEAPWVRKYGRDEGFSYAWRDYPGPRVTPSGPSEGGALRPAGAARHAWRRIAGRTRRR